MGNDSKYKLAHDCDPPKINHEKFSNRQIILNENEDEEILIKVSVPSENDWKRYKDSKFYFFRRVILSQKKAFVDHQIIYENYPFILSDEISNRFCLNERYFEENQLWFLTSTLLTAAEYFHSRGRKIGDVRPENIFISEDGTVKVACLESWPLEKNNYQKSFDKQITYLAPEQVNDLGYGKTQTNADLQLAQIFSIGLTILDAATLKDSSDLYKNQKQINFQILEARLKELEKRPYRKLFSTLIRNMCEINPNNRAKAREFYELLQPYETFINDFVQFQVQNLPAKFTNVPKNQTKQPLYTPAHYSSITSNVAPLSQLNLINLPGQSQVPTQFTFNSNSGLNKPIEPVSKIIEPAFTQNMPSYFSVPQPIGTAESTYIPYSSKFSLSKIDQQLQQSRKLFPS